MADDVCLHLHGAAEIEALVKQRAFGVFIVIHRRLENRNMPDMQEILQVENHILTVADGFIHPDGITLNDLTPVELIPQHAVIEVRRAEKHFIRILFDGENIAFFNRALLGDILVDHTVEITDDKLNGICLHLTDKELGGIHREPVIHIGKADIRARGLPEGPVAGRGNTAVFFMDGFDPVIQPGVLLHDGQRTVTAAVIHQYHLQIGIVLMENALHTPAKTALAVINRHDDTDLFHDNITPFSGELL